jgi:hypothetical protein
VTRRVPIPFGPEHKDPPWRWGSFLVGVAGFVLLAWIATLGDVNLIGFWWLLFIVLGFLLSIRSGRAWARGDIAELVRRRRVEPTIDVRGQGGSTYVLMEPARVKGPTVRPREFGPLWWALYSVAVRAPVALGDAVLTGAWRGSKGFWSSGPSAADRFELEHLEHVDDLDDLPSPDHQRF